MSAQIVTQVKAELLSRGFTFLTNCDAFQITARVAWLLRHEGAKLVVKQPEQNHCAFKGVRYAVDVIAFPTGWIDMLGSAGPPANANNPQWNPTGSSDAPLVDPFDLDETTDPPPPPPPPPPPGSSWIVAFTLELAAAGAAAIRQGEALQKAATILADAANTVPE